MPLPSCVEEDSIDFDKNFLSQLLIKPYAPISHTKTTDHST